MIIAALITALAATPSSLTVATRPGIMWFTDLKQGYAEAKATNRPIFLMSAAPQCAQVPGDW